MLSVEVRNLGGGVGEEFWNGDLSRDGLRHFGYRILKIGH